MSFSASDYLQRLSKIQHSDYISGYMRLGEVLKTLSIHAQSFAISKQQFFDQPVNQLISSDVRYKRAPLAARGSATCSMVQTCQVNWTITIPANILPVQLNRCEVLGADANNLNARVNFNAKANATTENDKNMEQANQFYYDKAADGPEHSEHLKFRLGFSTACGPFNQFAILRDAQNLSNTAIYAREQAVICSNSLTDLCINNFISVSPLESIIAGKRHCCVFIDIPLSDIDKQAAGNTPFFYLIPYDITFSGVLDLDQLNPIFNSFPVLTRNYASLYLQLWVQDFLQDLKIVWLNKQDTILNRHLAYAMIPPEKPDVVYLLSENEALPLTYEQYVVRLVNMQNVDDDATQPQNSISQISDAKFEELEMQNVCFNIENEEAIIQMIQAQRIINFLTQVIRSQSSNFPFSGFQAVSGSMQSIMSFANIKALFMTFALPQYPTWFFPVLFYNFNLVVDQKNLIPQPYKALIQTTNSQMFDCFVDQDVVSAPSDLYHSLTFENINANDKDDFYEHVEAGGEVGATANIFYNTTLFNGSKATKTLYPNKFMLAWKMATDDSFMRGYNSSKIGARTNIQVILNGNLTKGIVDTTQLIPSQNQNDFKQFIAMRSYPDPHQVALTPIMHYLCDVFIRITFVDNPDPYVLSMDVIGEIGGSSIRSG
ncbi:MAG: hypothetical protein EZS28_011365 [Streblomastix strix]|uniref:Uncharacterized protein n=1 Tax=Streblomastix strix TaxID=222440 RepID=A0A5J4WDU6_9EUKA|nr:MAG: hypothetical protein EZS28_011365 [Streblomastix strix]